MNSCSFCSKIILEPIQLCCPAGESSCNSCIEEGYVSAKSQCRICERALGKKIIVLLQQIFQEKETGHKEKISIGSNPFASKRQSERKKSFPPQSKDVYNQHCSANSHQRSQYFFCDPKQQ